MLKHNSTCKAPPPRKCYPSLAEAFCKRSIYNRSYQKGLDAPQQEDCVQMPGKIVRSAPRPSIGLPELLVAIHTSRQSCSKAEKARIFTPVQKSSEESWIMEETMADIKTISRRTLVKTGIGVLAAPAVLRVLPAQAQSQVIKIGHVSPKTGPLAEATDWTLAEACAEATAAAAESCCVAFAFLVKVPAADSSSLAAEDTPPAMLLMACSNLSASSRTMSLRSATTRAAACFCSASSFSSCTRLSRKARAARAASPTSSPRPV